MIHTGFRAMGTTVEAWVEGDPEQVRDWFEHVESVCSRFRPRSELSELNSKPGSKTVSPLIWEVLVAGERARALTGGLVDIGVGQAVAAWGYDRTFEEVSDIAEAPARTAPSGWSIRDGILDLKPGCRLDLGGVAKGWTCDRAVESGLAEVVSAGGDIRSGRDDTVVPVIDPWDDVVARVELGRRALATSSTTRRRWKVGDREASHIIDPRSMTPVVSPVLSATVVAGSTVDAEVGAKTVLIMGPDGLAWADDQTWIDSALVVWNDGSVYATGSLRSVA